MSDALETLSEGAGVHLEHGYDSRPTRERLADVGLRWEISEKGKLMPFWATSRWVVERTSSWQVKLANKKLAWCTEQVKKVIRLLGGALRRGDHGEAASPRRLDTLPLGGDHPDDHEP